MTERDKERGDGRDPLDEEAAWAEIVAGYGEAPRAPGDAPEPPRETGEERDGDGLVPGVWHPDAVPDHGSGGSAAAARADAAGTADTAASGDADGPTTGGTREG
ncbi:hypothetical protein HCJ92_19680, partial [Streptomyces sp. ventii]|nr:hypothetical protein [Streptomyces spiramenti]